MNQGFFDLDNIRADLFVDLPPVGNGNDEGDMDLEDIVYEDFEYPLEDDHGHHGHHGEQVEIIVEDIPVEDLFYHVIDLSNDVDGEIANLEPLVLRRSVGIEDWENFHRFMEEQDGEWNQDENEDEDVHGEMMRMIYQN
jgi:hypothetical protein